MFPGNTALIVQMESMAFATLYSVTIEGYRKAYLMQMYLSIVIAAIFRQEECTKKELK